MESTRRTFLKQAAGLSAACIVGFEGRSGAEATVLSGAANSAATASWYDRPMRWAQLSFVEDDPGNYDLQFWLDYFKRIHADATILNAGGCVAFYPTQIPSALPQQVAGQYGYFRRHRQRLPEAGHERGSTNRSRTHATRMFTTLIRTGSPSMKMETSANTRPILTSGSPAPWDPTTLNS